MVLLDVADHVHRTAEEIEAAGAVQVDVRDPYALWAIVHGVAREGLGPTPD